MTMKALCVLCADAATPHATASRSRSGEGSPIDLQLNRARFREPARPIRFSGATLLGNAAGRRRQPDEFATCAPVSMRIKS